MELELEILEARISAELATAARDLWTATASEPGAHLGVAPPILGADETRRFLNRARARGGDLGTRAGGLHRIALATAFAGEDRARLTPPAERTEAGFLAAAEARARIAARLGYQDVWSLILAISGDPDVAVEPTPEAVATPSDVTVAAHLADPRPLIAALAVAHAIDPAVITHVEIVASPAPHPGRTFAIAPGDDLRIRVWRRPDATEAGTLRVLLHELGHAFLAALATDTSTRAFDEAVAAWFASHLERPTFNVSVLGLSPADADALATSEIATRASRRARLTRAAAAERAFYLRAGPPPWLDALAWTDPGASAAYATAETLRDTLDASLGASYPTRRLQL